MRRVTLGFMISTVVATLSGCIMVPIPLSPREDDIILTQQDIEFLSVSETTKATVEERLGPPHLSNLDERVSMYKYSWRKVHIVIISGVDIVDGPLESHRILLIQFDESDFVNRFGVYYDPAYGFMDSFYGILVVQDTKDYILRDWVSDPNVKYLKPAKLPDKQKQ